jgi:hypothetical protein
VTVTGITLSPRPRSVFTVPANPVSLKLYHSASDGMLKGSFKHPGLSSPATPFLGVILQDLDSGKGVGRGFFIGPVPNNYSGSFLLQQ